MRHLATAFVLLAALVVEGCAIQTPTLTKPFVACRVSDGKALLEQGVVGPAASGGIGIGQELPDADALCAKLKAAPPASAASSS